MTTRRDEGTGKHPHKDTAEPYPHTKSGEQQQGGHETKAEQAHAGAKPGGAQSQGRRGEEESLKEREYKDEQGNIHHHTKTYMEQHGAKEKE